MSNPNPSPVEALEAAVRAGDVARRLQAVHLRLHTAAPVMAGAILLVSVGTRFLDRRPFATPFLLGGTLIVVAGALAWAKRRRPVDDRGVTRLDRDAGLGGELRSSRWFASHPEARIDYGNGWIACHLERAAARASVVSWTAVYPRPRAGRALTIAAALGAVSLTAPAWPMRPPRAAASGSTSAAATPASAAATHVAALLPQQSLPQLTSALRTMKAGGVPSKEMLAAVERAIREARENPILQSDLDTMFDELGDTEVEQLGPVQADELKNDALRQKEERDLQSGVSKLEWAFEDARSRSAAMTAPRGLGAARASKSGASGRQAAVPATSATAAAQPAGAAALIEQAATHDGPGTAVPGGLSSGSGLHEPDETAQAAARAAAARVTAALRHEVVHANADQQGANVHAAADRRVTNTGTSSATAASPVPTRVYARSRADRAAAVPEARRGLVRQYFSREGGEPAAGGQ